jgi:hypothetical protein
MLVKYELVCLYSAIEVGGVEMKSLGEATVDGGLW